MRNAYSESQEQQNKKAQKELREMLSLLKWHALDTEALAVENALHTLSDRLELYKVKKPNTQN